MEKNTFLLEGSNNEKDEISPTYINLTNPKYIEIDEIYRSGIIISNYYREQKDLLLKEIIDSDIITNISIFYEKQDTYKAIRDLTYYIGNVGVDIKTTNKNREDIDIASFTYNDAKYIRKELQVNNENIYFLYIYFQIYAKEKEKLEYMINKLEGILQSKGMQSKRSYFRQEQCFLSCLPIMHNNEDLKPVSRRNILTNGIVCTYPFISSNIFDEDGIFIGTSIYNNSLIFINRYDTKKYKNANICIFGTSGARKIIFYKSIYYKKSINRSYSICNRSR